MSSLYRIRFLIAKNIFVTIVGSDASAIGEIATDREAKRAFWLDRWDGDNHIGLMVSAGGKPSFLGIVLRLSLSLAGRHVVQLLLAHGFLHGSRCAFQVADLGVAAFGGQGSPGGFLLGLRFRGHWLLQIDRVERRGGWKVTLRRIAPKRPRGASRYVRTDPVLFCNGRGIRLWPANGTSIL